MQAGAGTQDWYIKLNDEDTVVVCTIIATAEYCIEVVGALGRSVAKTVDPPFGNKVCSPSRQLPCSSRHVERQSLAGRIIIPFFYSRVHAC